MWLWLQAPPELNGWEILTSLSHIAACRNGPCGAGMPAKCWRYRLRFRDLESPPSFGKLPRSASGGRRSRRNSNQDRNQGCRYAVPSPDNLTKRFAKAVRACCLRLIILWEPNVGRDSGAIFHLYISVSIRRCSGELLRVSSLLPEDG